MTLKRRLYEILERAKPGDAISRVFDITLVVLVVANALTFTLESIKDLNDSYGSFFYYFELFSVAFFTVEYMLRIWAITEASKYEHPITGRIRYFFSPMAIIDLLAILPFYLSGWLIDMRFLRILRAFRIFRLIKLVRYVRALAMIQQVLYKKREELVLCFVIMLTTLFFAASLMYVAEHDVQPDKFQSIPQAMWWSVATLTTVGYGDVYPITNLGRLLAGAISIIGVAIFALPAGIFAAGFSEEAQEAKQKLDEERAKAE
jgi:voltage-gated potassium channel